MRLGNGYPLLFVFNLLLYKQYRTVEFTINVSMPFGFELWWVAEILTNPGR